MKIDVTNLNPGAWFDMDSDPDGEAKVRIRAIPADELEKIRKKTEKKQPPEYRRGQRYEVPSKINEKLQRELIWDYSIMEWQGIYDANGSELPCNKENKIKLMSNSVAFANFVANSLEQLTLDVNQKEEELEKNL